MAARGRGWGLMFATLAFGLFAYGLLGLLAVALAALLLAAGVPRPRDRVTALLLGVGGLLFVVTSAADPFDAAVGAYSLIVAAAFAGGALLAPTGVWRQGIRSILWGIAGTGLLGLALRGTRFWSELRWSVMHQTSSAARSVVEVWPSSYPMYDPLVEFFVTSFPGLLVLQSLAALALAWHWHERLATAPLDPPVAPFRQFRFGDHWVWGLVGALLIWAIPRLAALKGVALNLGVVLSVLYCLRGAAIVVALAGGAGVPVWSLILGMVITVVLVVPLLLVIPSLWTLGVFDTWLAFRRRVDQSPVR